MKFLRPASLLRSGRTHNKKHAGAVVRLWEVVRLARESRALHVQGGGVAEAEMKSGKAGIFRFSAHKGGV
ncbi:hypothetical protein [Noviherbaspirillum agri]